MAGTDEQRVDAGTAKKAKSVADAPVNGGGQSKAANGADYGIEPEPSDVKLAPKEKSAPGRGDGGRAMLAAHGGARAVPHAHAPNRREYFIVFAVLFVLTVLEVGVAQLPGIARVLVGTALVSLAMTKAACVGLFYMHLKHETKVLKLTVAIPMATPMLYALVLIAEAAWRQTRW